jgi:phosphatidylglycerophosphate synthase
LHLAYRDAQAARSHGYLYTEFVTGPLSTPVAALALRYRCHPSLLTLGNLLLGLGASAAILASPPHRPFTLTAVAAALLWQLAYLLDCTDGQVARSSNKVTPHGARLDLLTDFAVQSSALVALCVAIARTSHEPLSILFAFATTWTLQLLIFSFTQTTPGTPKALSVVSSNTWLVKFAKLPRDYGFAILVLGAWLATAPASLYVPAIAYLALNGSLLAIHIFYDVYYSIRPPSLSLPPAPPPLDTPTTKDETQ